MSEFHTGIITIITIGFIIKNFNKQYLLNSIGLIGGFFLGEILLLKSISFLSLWKFLNINFILMNLITFLLITIEEESCIKKENSIEEESCKVEGTECNQLYKYCHISSVFLYLIIGFLDGFCGSSNFLFVVLFIRYKCLFKANLHHMFFVHSIVIILMIIIKIMMEGGRENLFECTKFFIDGPIVYGLISLIIKINDKNPRFFLVFGICIRIVAAILKVIFWLFPLTAYTLKL